jgi:hypothetical protein
MPTSFIIDRQGVTRFTHTGFWPADSERGSKVLPKRSQTDESELPDLDAILGAFGDARDLVAVVYTAFQTNGRDGPEQSVLCYAIKNLTASKAPFWTRMRCCMWDIRWS